MKKIGKLADCKSHINCEHGGQETDLYMGDIVHFCTRHKIIEN